MKPWASLHLLPNSLFSMSPVIKKSVCKGWKRMGGWYELHATQRTMPRIFYSFSGGSQEKKVQEMQKELHLTENLSVCTAKPSLCT